MLFSSLADLYEQLEKISSGNKIREVLSKFLKKVPKSEIQQVTYLTLGTIDSYFADVDMGMADKMVVKAIAKASNKDGKTVTKVYKKKGDVGLTAQLFAGKKKKTLTVKEVFKTLTEIANSSGKGSQERKIDLLARLIQTSSPKESKYITRIVVSKMRLGFSDKTVLDSLSIAFTGSKEAKKDLDYAFSICPDVGIIAKTIATKGVKGIKRINVQLERPIQSMLCQRIDNLSLVPGKMGVPFAVEEKYDGERIQVHKNGNKINLYSRRLENITNQFPDLVEAIKKSVTAKKAIIDGEVMPIDPKTGKLLAFQKLMSRRRKYDIEKYIKQIPIAYFVFDILYHNGKSLIRTPYQKRYSLLQKSITKTKKVQFALKKMCKTPECIEQLFKKVIKQGGEGVVIKDLHGPYQAGTRGWHWIKWKPEYVKGLQDTFDLVIVGGFYGKGKRAGLVGSYLCAAYNKSKDRYETFTKVASGFTEKDLASMPKKLSKYKIPNQPKNLEIKKIMKPDVWYKPGLVIEVLGAEITKSPNHTAANLALRFPRFLRIRDKRPTQATTITEIKKIATKKKR